MNRPPRRVWLRQKGGQIIIGTKGKIPYFLVGFNIYLLFGVKIKIYIIARIIFYDLYCIQTWPDNSSLYENR